MSYLEQSKQNAAARRDSAELEAMKRDVERVNISEAAKAEGANFGYQQGRQEGAQQVAGFKQQLMDLFGRQQEPVPQQGLAGRYSQQAQDQRRQMEQDAQQEAFIRADELGDRSEGTMNILINEELKRRGL